MKIRVTIDPGDLDVDDGINDAVEESIDEAFHATLGRSPRGADVTPGAREALQDLADATANGGCWRGDSIAVDDNVDELVRLGYARADEHRFAGRYHEITARGRIALRGRRAA